VIKLLSQCNGNGNPHIAFFSEAERSRIT